MGEGGTREVRLERIEDLADPRLAPYTTMTDAALRRRVDAEHGVFLAESSQCRVSSWAGVRPPPGSSSRGP
ncbi:hypothetical protein [Micrococcus sp. HSID17227]|uniref:hypothetical protein n=1 Tax=Micrococcus sp. HSID17227 TaxID=2419506 RepID=UPI001EE90DE5|nr:hypothetical protein [Micrococcus sp. HSID17227]